MTLSNTNDSQKHDLHLSYEERVNLVRHGEDNINLKRHGDGFLIAFDPQRTEVKVIGRYVYIEPVKQ